MPSALPKKKRCKKKRRKPEKLRIDQAPSQVGTEQSIGHSGKHHQDGTQGVQLKVLRDMRQSHRQQIEDDQKPKERVFGLKKSGDFHDVRDKAWLSKQASQASNLICFKA
jgi:hypothetical protein